MKSSILYNRKTINIPVGSNAVSDIVNLSSGDCVGVYIIPFTNKDPNYSIEVGIQTSQNGDIITATDFRDYFHKGGGYLPGVKQLNFPTDKSQFFINVNCSKPVDVETTFQLVFIIRIGDATNTLRGVGGGGLVMSGSIDPTCGCIKD